MEKLKEIKRLFKKHYKRAQKLKEGGTAWDREITKARHFLTLGRQLYEQEQAKKYSY